MIRFVYIGDQINEDTREFAFFCTVRDSFETIGGESTFDSPEDFEAAWESEYGKSGRSVIDEYERRVALIPGWYIDGEDPPRE